MAAAIVYSTGIGRLCPNCRRAVKACVCPKRGRGSAAPDGAAPDGATPGSAKAGAIRVGREVKGRAGKGVTTVTGLPLTPADIDALATRLKKRCGSGGTVRDGVIEIQGEHREVILAELAKLGWPAKQSGG
jgi:translation initiation factor 1